MAFHLAIILLKDSEWGHSSVKKKILQGIREVIRTHQHQIKNFLLLSKSKQSREN